MSGHSNGPGGKTGRPWRPGTHSPTIERSWRTSRQVWRHRRSELRAWRSELARACELVIIGTEAGHDWTESLS